MKRSHEANDLGLGWALHRALDRVAETTGAARIAAAAEPSASAVGSDASR